MLKHIAKYILYIVPIIAGLILIIIFNSLHPAQAGPFGILVVFICVYLVCLGILFFFLRNGLHIIEKITLKKSRQVFDAKKAYYIASVIAFLPTLLLAIQSVGQLQLSDILLVCTFIGLTIFYIIKRI